MYKDTESEARKHILASDKSRAIYYEVISNQKWKDMSNYDLCINCEIGSDVVTKIIIKYINNKNMERK